MHGAFPIVSINSLTSSLDTVGDFTLRKLKCQGVRDERRLETNTVSRCHQENLKMMMLKGDWCHSEALLRDSKDPNSWPRRALPAEETGQA